MNNKDFYLVYPVYPCKFLYFKSMKFALIEKGVVWENGAFLFR